MSQPTTRFSPFMLIGLMATIFLIPLIRGSDGEPLALETLAVGHDRPQNKLNKIRKWKVKKAVRGNDVRDEENREYAGDPTAAEEQGMIPDQPDDSGDVYEMEQMAQWHDEHDAIDEIA